MVIESLPYVTKEERLWLDTLGNPKTPGQLNYLITKYCLRYLEQEKVSYARLNEIIGVLECAKQEFYRRAATPYEDKKKKDNGDIY